MKNKRAFTLAEIMIALLVISLITAAFLPVITKRSKQNASGGSSIWQYVSGSGPGDIYFNDGGTLGAIIGATRIEASDGSTRLLLNTSSLSQNAIVFKQTVLGMPAYQGRLVVDSNKNVGLGLVEFNNSTPAYGPAANIDATAVGNATQATENQTTAFGSAAKATAVKATAVGNNTEASGINSVALGYNSAATGDKGISIGVGNTAKGALGTSIAIGDGSMANGNYAIAIGNYDSNLTWTGHDNAYADGPGIAIGSGTKASSGSTAVGFGAVAYGSGTYGAVAIGGSDSTAIQSISIGDAATASGKWSTAIGFDTRATGTCALAIGSALDVSSSNRTESTGSYSMALGSDTKATKSYSIAEGYAANATGASTTAIGHSATAAGDNNTAIGYNACKNVLGSNKTCIGVNSGPLSGGTYSGAADTYERIFIGQAADTGKGALFEVHGPGGGSYTAVVNGRLYVNGSIDYEGVCHDVSDRRLKNVKENFTEGLDQINSLEVYHYTLKNDKKKTPYVGVMAQDLKKIFPDAVTKNDKGFFIIRKEDMFYAMVNSIKQLDKMFTELAQKVQSVIANVQTLDDKVLALVKVDQINCKKIKELEIKNKALEKQNKSFEARLKKLEQK